MGWVLKSELYIPNPEKYSNRKGHGKSTADNQCYHHALGNDDRGIFRLLAFSKHVSILIMIQTNNVVSLTHMGCAIDTCSLSAQKRT